MLEVDFSGVKDSCEFPVDDLKSARGSRAEVYDAVIATCERLAARSFWNQVQRAARLFCQAEVVEASDGLVVTVPANLIWQTLEPKSFTFRRAYESFVVAMCWLGRLFVRESSK